MPPANTPSSDNCSISEPDIAMARFMTAHLFYKAAQIVRVAEFCAQVDRLLGDCFRTELQVDLSLHSFDEINLSNLTGSSFRRVKRSEFPYESVVAQLVSHLVTNQDFGSLQTLKEDGFEPPRRVLGPARADYWLVKLLQLALADHMQVLASL